MACCKDPLVDLVNLYRCACTPAVILFKEGQEHFRLLRFLQGEVKTVGRERWVLASGGRIMAVRSQVRDPLPLPPPHLITTLPHPSAPPSKPCVCQMTVSSNNKLTVVMLWEVQDQSGCELRCAVKICLLLKTCLLCHVHVDFFGLGMGHERPQEPGYDPRQGGGESGEGF